MMASRWTGNSSPLARSDLRHLRARGVASGPDIFLRTRREANCFPGAAKSALLMAASGNKAYKASGSSSERNHSGEKGLNGIVGGWVKSSAQHAAVDKGRYRAV